MANVGIVADSTNSLPAELIEKYDIRVTPVVIVIDGKPYRDQVDISSTEFFKIQKNLKDIPTTTGVGTGEFIAAFKDLSKTTKDILCLSLSTGISGTYDAAVQAKKTVQDESPEVNIEIIDTKTAAGAMGLIALESARAANQGKSLVDVVEVARNMLPRTRWIAALDTLNYLVKGGRAPKVAGFLGELIRMKPIIGFNTSTGAIDMLGRVRTKEKAMAKMVEIARENMDTDRPAHCIINYATDIEDGEKLRDMITSEINCEELYMTQITPVMCCHTGPMQGLAFYS